MNVLRILPDRLMVGMKMNQFSFSSGSVGNYCYFIFKAGRSSNGRTPPSGGGYLGSSPGLPALNRKSVIGETLEEVILVRVQVWQQAKFFINFFIKNYARLLAGIGRERRRRYTRRAERVLVAESGSRVLSPRSMYSYEQT